MLLRIHKVVGDSMSPTVQHHDYVISVYWWRMRYQINDIVIIKHTTYGTIIKRITEQKPTGEILLIGDNSAASTSSLQLGWQEPSKIIGKLVWTIPRRI